MTPAVELDDIRLDRDGRRVLDGARLRLSPGERIALSGANGAGKTTLLRVIAGLTRPGSGEVRIDGRSCRTEADFRPARLGIGFLFQESDDQLFCPTVIEDVAFGPLNQGLSRSEARARAEAMLADLGLSALAERPPHHLSGGEKRLVCLAGLLVMEPRLLLLDEPTNGLDDTAEHLLVARLDAFTGAMIIVTHDPALPDRLGARRLRLDGGCIREG